MKKSASVLLSLLAVAGSGCSLIGNDLAGGYPSQVDQLFAEWDQPDTPGCALAVGFDGEPAYERGYGLADLDHGMPIQSTTVFDIGSVSKQFTSATLFLLADRGELSIDDDIRAYLHEVPQYQRPITLRHLIHHTSGIRDYLDIMSLSGRSDYDLLSDQDIVEMVARQENLNFAPGAEYLYSNSGYMLLAVIAKRVTGMTLGELAEREIFQPTGMNSTFFYEDRTRIVQNRALGYDRIDDDSFRLVHNFNFAIAGDGQLYTTVQDLLRWNQQLYGGTFGGDRLRSVMLERGVLSDDSSIDYAFGLVHGEHRGLQTVGHGGSSWGFRAHLVRFPDAELSVSVLCNVNDASPQQLALQVAEIYLGDRMEPASPDPPTADEDPVPTGAVADTARLIDYVGEYDSEELLAIYRVELIDDRLYVRLRDQPYIEMQLIDEDTFAADGSMTALALSGARFRMTFDRHADDSITGFTADTGRARNLRFTRR